MATTGLRKLINDENVIDKAHKIKVGKHSKAPPATKKQTRAALGELGNKTLVPNPQGLLSKIKEATNQEISKIAKAKVDTHWKNEGRGLIRTESLRSKKNTVNSTNSNIAVTSNKAHIKCHNTKVNSTNTKVNTTVLKSVQEQKPAILKAVKPVNTKKEIPNQKFIIKKDEVLILRREESNLSRRSLTKLRAALSKDTTKREGIVAAKTENGISISIKDSKNIQNTDTKNEIAIQKVKVKEHFLPEPSNVKIETIIDDIDSNDIDNIFALTEYVNDIYKYLNELEDIFKIEENFMKNQTQITPRMRTVLLDWINEVAHQFRLMSDTYQITVGIIDRYLQIIPHTTKGQLQLVGVTALFIATKYEELYSSDIGDFIYMTDNSYTKEEIIDMEKKIMKSLHFQLSRPYPLQFLRRFSKAIGADQIEHLLAKYILELVSIEYTLVHYKPSEMAAAALHLSVHLLNLKGNLTDEFWNKTIEHYSGYSSSNLKSLVRKIAFVLKNAPKAKTKSIYLKFKHEKFQKISTRPELYGKLIDSIIDSNE